MGDSYIVNLALLDRFLLMEKDATQRLLAEIDSYLTGVFGVAPRYSNAPTFKLYGLCNSLMRKQRNAELNRILNLLESISVKPAVLKGAAIDGEIYPNANVRHIGDIDLLLPEASILQACQLLEENGYRLSSPLCLSDENHVILYGDRFTLEIHRRLTKGDFPFDDGILLQSNRTLSISDGELCFQTLGITETFIYLLLHLYGHVHNDAVMRWLRFPDNCLFVENIPRYFDIALFAIHHKEKIQWARVWDILEAIPFRSIMKEILLEITDLCPGTIPNEFLNQIFSRTYAAHEPTDRYVQTVRNYFQRDDYSTDGALVQILNESFGGKRIESNKTYVFSERQHNNPHGTCIIAGKDTGLSCSWKFSLYSDSIYFHITVTDNTPVYITQSDTISFDFDSVCLRLATPDGIYRYKALLLCPTVNEEGHFDCRISEPDNNGSESVTGVAANTRFLPHGYEIDVSIESSYFNVQPNGRLLFDIQINDCAANGKNRACCMAAFGGSDDWYWPAKWNWILNLENIL